MNHRDRLRELISLIEESGAKMTFSINCCSGLVPAYAARCECWRCRRDRGEEPDEELAKKVSDAARRAAPFCFPVDDLPNDLEAKP